MTFSRVFLIVFLSSFFILNWQFSWAQKQDPLKVHVQLLPNKIKPYQPVKLLLQLNLPPSYHAYKDQFALRLDPKSGFQLGEWSVGPLKTWYDKFSKKQREGIEGKGELVAELIAPEHFNSQELNFELDYQACGETFCLFPTTQKHKVSFTTLGLESTPPMMGWDLQRLFKQSLEKSLVLAFLLAFIAGIMTSLTPCVYPMIPITLAVLTRGADKRKQSDQFTYSLIYVMGIATTFSMLGLAAAQFGFLFGSLLNQIWILILISLVLLAMGLSLIGIFEIQLPMVFMNYATSQYASGKWGAYISGLFFGIVASPCVGPILVAILAWVSSTQSPLLGFGLLFVYALGLGVLFIGLGFFSKVLPRSGAWMVSVKKLMGMFVLAVSAYYIFLIWQQAQFFQQAEVDEAQIQKQSLPWKPLTPEALAEARGKPVIVDFWALWCAACHELEQFTFTDPRVQKEAEKFFLFKYDATNVTPETQKWMEKFSIRGLPAVIFLSPDGQWLEDLTLNEYEKADPFLVRMQKALKTGPITQ